MKTPQEELHYLGLMLTATDINDSNRISAICARIKELTE